MILKEVPELDMAELLENEEIMAAYLSEIMATGDSELIMSAIGDIARAKGISAIAKEAGVNRESLYKAFRPGASPQFSTVLKIMAALKLNLQAVPS